MTDTEPIRRIAIIGTGARELGGAVSRQGTACRCDGHCTERGSRIEGQRNGSAGAGGRGLGIAILPAGVALPGLRSGALVRFFENMRRSP
jgi:hypothetical protein